MLVDNAAYQLVVNPCQFKSYAYGEYDGRYTYRRRRRNNRIAWAHALRMYWTKSIFEPAHGSAPSIAGKILQNPYSMIGSAAMMLEKIWNGKRSK